MPHIDYNKISNADKSQSSNIIDDVFKREKEFYSHYIPYHAISCPTKSSRDFLRQKNIVTN